MPLSISLSGLRTRAPDGSRILIPIARIGRDQNCWKILHEEGMVERNWPRRMDIEYTLPSGLVTRLKERLVFRQLRAGTLRAEFSCRRAGQWELITAVLLLAYPALALFYPRTGLVNRNSLFELPMPIWCWVVSAISLLGIIVVPTFGAILIATRRFSRIAAGFKRDRPIRICVARSRIRIECANGLELSFPLSDVLQFHWSGSIALRGGGTTIYFEPYGPGIHEWRVFTRAANRYLGVEESKCFMSSPTTRNGRRRLLAIAGLGTVVCGLTNWMMNADDTRKWVGSTGIIVLLMLLVVPLVIDWRRVRRWLRRNNHTKILAMFAPSCTFKA